MNSAWHSLSAIAACILMTSAASAQTSATSPSGASSASRSSTSPSPAAIDRVDRPATTTFFGDTGLWYVPTAEVLPGGNASVSGYRRGTNYVQGYTNIGDFSGSAAIGLGGRVEAFGAFLFDTRVNRDTRPLLTTVGDGGIVDRYPRVTESWTGDHIGDLFVGGKVNLLSESRDSPLALAVRGLVKVPTGSVVNGVSTGKTDVSAQVIVSKDIAQLVNVSGYGGYAYRGEPDGFVIPGNAIEWGGGAAIPSHSRLRAFGEIAGDIPSRDTALTMMRLVADDGSVAPFLSSTENLTRLTGGFTYQAISGFFAGAGLSWNVPQQNRIAALAFSNPFGDYWDYQVRIGFHPGVRRYMPRPAPIAPPPPAPPAPPPVARPAPAAPAPEPSAPVVAPPPRSYTFEDVHFEFDLYSLRPEATRLLDEAIAALKADSTIRVLIEGHTCNIGSAEYNLALSERRARSVQQYLVSRGITADRLQTASYGEENAKFDNDREETRRLNRRSTLVVKLHQ